MLLEKEQEITSLNHRLGVLDADLEKAEAKITEYKASSAEGENSRTTNEGLQRKIQLLEEELDAAEKNAKETVEKYAFSLLLVLMDTDRWRVFAR